MLQLYDLNKVKISNLTLFKDLKIQSVLSTGDKTLSFSYPSRSSDEIKEEGYIRTKTHEFVIKEISTNGDWKSIQAVLNVEDLEGKTWEHFDTSNQTITECLKLALAGTGWIIGYCNETKKRTISKTNCSTWDIIQEIKKTYFVEMEFDTLNKRINIAKKLGNDKGVYFIDSLNLKDLDVKSNSYDFCTRLIAIGKDNLKVTVENYQYSSKKKTIIWKDEKYTDENSLREDAIAKLEELSKPYKSYGADIVDLASINDKYSILSYGLGDIITLISKEEGIKEKQRIVKMVEYPDEPDKNTCDIANTVLTFEDMQKEYEDTSKTVNNITSSNGTISEGAIKGTVEKITIKKADIESLNAVEMRVGDLEATSATVTQLDVANANIADLQANKANITELNAGVGRIDILESSVGDIKTLVNGNLTSNNIQSLILTSDKVTVDNGFIKNAMIDNLDVSKIKAGDISTNKFKIKSDNGGIEIVGATQQFKDKNNNVRIQMGQDTKGDFNFILRGEDGTTTLIDHTGIKEKAIANDLIKENMVATNAIGEKQINYSSIITGLNKDTNTQLIKASKVALDLTGQSLEVSFNSLSNTIYADPPSITTDNSITKLDGSIDGMLRVNNMYGNTLQNLLLPNSTVIGSESVSYWYKLNIYPILGLGGKTVTLINTTPRELRFNFTNLDNSNQTFIDVPAYSKIKTTIDIGRKIQAIVGTALKGWNESNKNELLGMILEGDWTNKETLQYFEGIRSVSETSKDLFNSWFRGEINPTTGEIVNKELSNVSLVSQYIDTKPNYQYKCTLDDTYRSFVAFYDIDKKYISRTGANPVKELTFYAPSNCYYMALTQYGGIEFKPEILNSLKPDIREVFDFDSGLELVSCGKNLLNGVTEDKEYTVTGTSSPVILTDYIEVNKDKKYILSTYIKDELPHTDITGSGILRLDIYNSAKVLITNIGVKGTVTKEYTRMNSDVINLPSEAKYIRLNFRHANGSVGTIKNAQLEEGIIATPYEPYQEHRQPILLTEPLRGLPNNVRDTIKGNVLTRNVGKIALNGSESWLPSKDNDTVIKFYFQIPLLASDTNVNAICDKFQSPTHNQGILDTYRTEGCWTNNLGRIYISILKSKLTTPDIAGFKTWLQANPVTVYYQLATPVETPIDVTQYMKQFKDGYFLTDGSLINPTVDLTYSTSIASATSMMKDVTESNTTALNIQQGKISTLISNTTVEKDGQTIQLKDAYNSTVATVDSINSVISKHTSTIDALTGQITGVDTKVNTVQRDLDGVKTSVSTATTTANSALSKATEAKQTADEFSQRVSNIETNYATTSAMNSAITQSATGIKSEVSNTFVSKADATNTYATKASMELTDSQLRLDFSGSGGYNHFLRKCPTGSLVGNATIQQEYGPGYDSRCKSTRIYANGNFESRFSRVINKNGVYSVSFYARSRCGNYPTLYIQLCDVQAHSQNVSIKTEWVLVKFENIVVNNYSDIYNFMDIGIKYPQSLYWDFELSHICINEGTKALPWSPNPTEIYQSSTQIDGNGVEINNGALKVTNTNSQVVIDGKYNMHKIMATGIITLELPVGITERTYYIEHGLGFMPAHSCYEMLDTTRCIALPAMSLANVGDSFGFSDILRARADTTKLYLDFIRTESEKNKYQSAKVRYFIYKEVAF